MRRSATAPSIWDEKRREACRSPLYHQQTPDRSCPVPPDSLDAGGEADDGEEEPVEVEVLEHALHREAVDAEGDAGHAQVQAAAYHVVCRQRVLAGRGHGAGHAACGEARVVGGAVSTPHPWLGLSLYPLLSDTLLPKAAQRESLRSAHETRQMARDSFTGVEMDG